MGRPNSADLRLQNRKLKTQLTALQKARSGEQLQLRNTLGSLVQSANAQTNLTSFNPILMNNIYAPLTINWTILTYMYKTHGILQTAIDMPVLDAFRGGLDLKSAEIDEEELKEFSDELVEDGIIENIVDALIWTRLYGGGALVINTDQDPATPLNLKRVGKFELYAANRWELMSSWKLDANSKMVNPWEQAANRTQDFYTFYGEKLHKSRVLTISGKAAPHIVRWQLQGWGMSEYERMVEDFNAYIKTKNVLYELLNEAKLDVYMLEGLKAALMSAPGTAKIHERVSLMNELKAFNNALILDKNDVFEQKQITFAGIAEVMKENRIGIAAALRMPLAKIFGLSAAGFNSGEDDIENYNAMVESEVRQKARKVVREVIRLKMIQKFGGKFDFSFNYKPLRVLSTVEEETVKSSKSNRLLAYFDRGLIDSREMGEAMKKDDLISVDTRAVQGLLDDHPTVGAEDGGEEGEK